MHACEILSEANESKKSRWNDDSVVWLPLIVYRSQQVPRRVVVTLTHFWPPFFLECNVTRAHTRFRSQKNSQPNYASQPMGASGRRIPAFGAKRKLAAVWLLQTPTADSALRAPPNVSAIEVVRTKRQVCRNTWSFWVILPDIKGSQCLKFAYITMPAKLVMKHNPKSAGKLR